MTLRLDEDDRYWHENQQENPKWFQFENPLRYVFFLLGIIIIIVALWYWLTSSPIDKNNHSLPLIRAEEFPLKKKIENMSVVSVKHQDKLVYKRLTGDEENGPVEHILPDSGASVSHMKEDAKRDNDKPVKMVQQYIDGEHEASQQLEEVDGSIEDDMKQKEVTMDDLLEGAEEGLKEQKESSLNQKKSPIMLQLGSLKSPEHAKKEWLRLSKKYPQELAGVDYKITRVDLGQSKGVYYLLRVGPFQSLEKAKAISNTLKEKKIESVVIHEES